MVAKGSADGYYFNADHYDKSIRVIDIAASALILREAGGEIVDLSGNRLDMPFDLKVRSNFLAYGDEDGQGGLALKFGMSVNMDVPDAPRLAKRALQLLEGHEVLLESEIAERFKKKGRKVEDMDVDIMITVGGDGTILRAIAAQQGAHLRHQRRRPGLPDRGGGRGAGGRSGEHPQGQL